MPKEEQEPIPDRRHSGDKKQKLDTTIGIAHILTTITMIVGLFTVVSDMRTNLALNTMEINSLKAERTREVRELKDSVHEVSQKVDRLIERGIPVSPNYKLDSHRYPNGS